MRMREVRACKTGKEAGTGRRLGGLRRIGLVVLAAGASRRMGACKLVTPLASLAPTPGIASCDGPRGGETLLGRALATACAFAERTPAVVEVAAVTGAYREMVAPVVVAAGVCELHNAAWATGQASSVALAARHAWDGGLDALLVMVADQPFVGAAHLARLVDGYLASAHAPSSSPCVWRAFQPSTGRRGNPCLFARSCFPLLAELSGDEGARSLFRTHPDLPVCDVPFDDPLVFEDVDTPEEAAHVTAMLRGEGCLYAL